MFLYTSKIVKEYDSSDDEVITAVYEHLQYQ